MSDQGLPVEIPLDQLHESPFNPRQIFRGIEELAETLKGDGRILQPLLVRPRVPPLFADQGADASCGFEIVFGHRRSRAARLAGLATAPCMVRTMTDAEVRRAQTIENLQREDVHPFEEAAGFEQLLFGEGGLSADQIAEQFGKSRSYVYGRLKLLQACQEVRQACLEGHIGAETALLIARLRTEKLQTKALAGIRSRLGSFHLQDGGKSSFRRVRDYLIEHFSLELKKAIFPIEEEKLLPAAGACGPCPKRSGNAPEFEDLATEKKAQYGSTPAGPDVCTDPDCFAAKKAAHLAREAKALADKGQLVITGSKAAAAIDAHGTVKGAYVELAKVRDEVNAANKKGIAPVAVVQIQNMRTGKFVKAVKVADLVDAGVRKAEPKHKAGSGSGSGTDWEAQRREREAAATAENERRRAVHAAVRPRMLAAPGSTDDLRLVLLFVLKDIANEVEQVVLPLYGIDPRARARLPEAVQALSADQLRTLLLDLVIEEGTQVDYDPESGRELLDMAARLYGVDPEATPTPSSAGASAEEAAAGAGKPKSAPKGKGKTAAVVEIQTDEASAVADAGQMDKAGSAGGGTRPPARNLPKYRNPATGDTWSGRGLKPKWLAVAIQGGKTLKDFEL